jgi:SAM-dependent methyltransferase
MPTTWLDAFTKQVRRAGTYPYPHQAAFFLDNPVRRLLANPGHSVDGIGLTGSERVLELGPGPGFFSVEIARRLTTGQLELFDLQPEMLSKARRKLDRASFANVGFHSGEASDGLPFPDGSIDVAFLASVIGEVPDKSACVRSLARVLKPGGSLVFLEGFPDPDRLSVQDLRQLAEPEDFSFVDAKGTRWHDIVRFRRD